MTSPVAPRVNIARKHVAEHDDVLPRLWVEIPGDDSRGVCHRGDKRDPLRVRLYELRAYIRTRSAGSKKSCAVSPIGEARAASAAAPACSTSRGKGPMNALFR